MSNSNLGVSSQASSSGRLPVPTIPYSIPVEPTAAVVHDVYVRTHHDYHNSLSPIPRPKPFASAFTTELEQYWDPGAVIELPKTKKLEVAMTKSEDRKVPNHFWPANMAVQRVPAYIYFARIEASVGNLRPKMLTHLPMFDGSARDGKPRNFQVKAYANTFDKDELVPPLSCCPEVDTISRETLRRLLLLQPKLSFTTKGLQVLPLPVGEITHLDSFQVLLPFPTPNPSSSRFSGPSLAELLSRRDPTSILAILLDSEGSWCSLCGVYNCRIHASFLEVDEHIRPKYAGLPIEHRELFKKRKSKFERRPCSASCFLDEEENMVACNEENLKGILAAIPDWPKDLVDLVQATISAIPNIIPCNMVNMALSDSGEPLYSCKEFFFQRCHILAQAQAAAQEGSKMPKIGAPDPVASKGKSRFEAFHKHMIPTQPCHHEGLCLPGCQCVDNRMYCEPSCHCSESCGHRFKGCKGSCTGGRSCSPESASCPCRKRGRECIPELCGNCWGKDGVGKCSNMHLQLRHNKRCEVRPAEHGWGLFLARGELVKKGEFLMEYIGEEINAKESHRRGMYQAEMPRNYQFDLNAERLIDASLMGNDSRFINEPDLALGQTSNCIPEIYLVNGTHRIAMFAKRDIRGGEELLLSYGDTFHPGKRPAAGRTRSGGVGR